MYDKNLLNYECHLVWVHLASCKVNNETGIFDFTTLLLERCWQNVEELEDIKCTENYLFKHRCLPVRFLTVCIFKSSLFKRFFIK